MRKGTKGGSICGGVISQSMDREMTKKHGTYVTMMCYVLPDKQYKKYISLKRQGKNKEATEIFERFSCSII